MSCVRHEIKVKADQPKPVVHIHMSCKLRKEHHTFCIGIIFKHLCVNAEQPFVHSRETQAYTHTISSVHLRSSVKHNRRTRHDLFDRSAMCETKPTNSSAVFFYCKKIIGCTSTTNPTGVDYEVSCRKEKINRGLAVTDSPAGTPARGRPGRGARPPSSSPPPATRAKDHRTR